MSQAWCYIMDIGLLAWNNVYTINISTYLIVRNSIMLLALTFWSEVIPCIVWLMVTCEYMCDSDVITYGWIVYALYSWLKEKIFLDDNLDICIVDYTVIIWCAVWLYNHSVICCAVDHSSDNNYWCRCDIFIYWRMVSIVWLNNRNTELWLWSLLYYFCIVLCSLTGFRLTGVVWCR